MRDKELIRLRNKKILERFQELQQDYRHTHVIIRKLVPEFWLSERTLTDIIYSKQERESHQISLFC